MTNRYEGREIWDVTVDVGRNVLDSRTKRAAPGLSCKVVFSLKAMDMDVGGPGGTFGFALPDMPGATLDEIEEAAMQAALDLMERFTAGGMDAVRGARAKQHEHAMTPYEFKFEPKDADEAADD
jgi:hypothetical protein